MSVKSCSLRYTTSGANFSCAYPGEISELQEELVNLVLDSSESIYLRASAAKTISSIGDCSTRSKLKLLAIQEVPEDDHDRLKGYCLEAVWPDHLTAQELFNSLAPPKRRNFTGPYQIFLDFELAQTLQPSDLTLALNWVEKQGLRYFGHPFEELADAILLKAWEHLESLDIVETFAKIAFIQWKKLQGLISTGLDRQTQFNLKLSNEDGKRRKLLEALVNLTSNLKEKASFLQGSYKERLLFEKDTLWMLDKLVNTTCERSQKIWAKLILWTFNKKDTKVIDAIILISEDNKVLREEFDFYLYAIELDSDRAEKSKVNYLETLKWNNPDRSKKLLEPPPKERIILLLDQLENGDLSAWWRLNMEMMLEPDSRFYDEDFNSDLTEFSGWQEADESTRQRIISGAKQYVQQQDEVRTEWVGRNTFNRPALAGCRAFQLLLQMSPDFFETISFEIWQKWVPIIVGFPCGGQHKDIYLELVKLTYSNAPTEVIETLIRFIDKESKEHNHLSIISKIERCWDKNLSAVLLEKAKDKSLNSKCMGQLLEEIIQHRSDGAREYAKSLISYPLPSADDERARAIVASKVLLENAEPASWTFIWSVIQQDTSFGREVIETVANRSYPGGIHSELTEKQFADLYIWLVHQYPYDEDPDHSDDVHATIVGTRESVTDFRNSILEQLKNFGTLKACNEIQRIVQEFPELTWLTKTLILAQNNMRRKTWESPDPDKILQIIQHKQTARHDTNIQAEVLIMNNPNLNFNAPTGAININSTVYGDQIGEQHNYAQEQNLVNSFEEIQQIIDRLTQVYSTSTEAKRQIIVEEAVKEAEQNPKLMKRLKAALQAFTFEAIQKISDQWWVSPFIKAIESGIKAE